MKFKKEYRLAVTVKLDNLKSQMDLLNTRQSNLLTCFNELSTVIQLQTERLKDLKDTVVKLEKEWDNRELKT